MLVDEKNDHPVNGSQLLEAHSVDPSLFSIARKIAMGFALGRYPVFQLSEPEIVRRARP